jgi:hypothetical protein
MSDLIERQAAIAFAISGLTRTIDGEKYIRVREVRQSLRDMPPFQSEHKAGKWEITDAYPHNVYCSVCHKRFAQTHWVVWQDGSLPREYCPNCGAKMEGNDG